MITIQLHEQGQITARGATAREINEVAYYASRDDVTTVTIDATDWLQGQTLASVTAGGTSLTVSGNKAAFNLTASNRERTEIVVTSSTGRKKRINLYAVTDEDSNDYGS